MYFRGKGCSKNNSLLERVDSRAQHIWRLRVMGSCFLVASVGSKRGGKQTRTRLCRRISVATFIKSFHAEHAQTKCPSAYMGKKRKPMS